MSLRRTETALVVCVVGLACFIGGQAVGMRRATRPQVSAGAIGERISADMDRGLVEARDVRVDGADAFQTAAPEMTVENTTTLSAPTMLLRDVRRRIDDGAAGTYIDDLLRARDSAVVRWPDRTTRPLRVWIAEDDQLAGWNTDFLPAVRDAFDTWVRTGIPVRFTFVIDSASADVHVRFTERFASGISGKTIWSRDSAWWLVSSDIQLALAHPGGGTVTPPQIRAIALHEVGHLLGLDHSSAAEHIMSARIRVRDLTEADRATVRLLYSIPAGSLR
jgi:Matrixin